MEIVLFQYIYYHSETKLALLSDLPLILCLVKQFILTSQWTSMKSTELGIGFISVTATYPQKSVLPIKVPIPISNSAKLKTSSIPTQKNYYSKLVTQVEMVKKPSMVNSMMLDLPMVMVPIYLIPPISSMLSMN
jgi:hypothetical protein